MQIHRQMPIFNTNIAAPWTFKYNQPVRTGITEPPYSRDYGLLNLVDYGEILTTQPNYL